MLALAERLYIQGMPSRCRMKRSRLTPAARARIVWLRRHVPWLGLRKIAAAMGLSLAEVRLAIVTPPPSNPLAVARRCPVHGVLVKTWPCVQCLAEGVFDDRRRPEKSGPWPRQLAAARGTSRTDALLPPQG